jgi:hypothetical protein
MSDFQVDEDTFVFPAGWHRHRYARRGSSGIAPFVPDPKARAVLKEEQVRHPGTVARVLEAPTTPADIRAAGNTWYADDPSAPPIGAAAVAAGLRNWDTRSKLVAFADVWIAERGIRFAAEAAVHLMSLQFCDDNAPAGPHHTGKDHYGVRPMRAGEIRHGWHADLPMQVLLRVRHALAAATDADYAATVTPTPGWPPRSWSRHRPTGSSRTWPPRSPTPTPTGPRC